MICTECKCEYTEGFLKCSDCGIDLVPNTEVKEIRVKISEKGISLVKYGIGLLFSVAFQIITIVIIYEFYWVYRLGKGGVSGTVIQNVHPIIWSLIVLESIVSVSVLCWGISKKNVK